MSSPGDVLGVFAKHPVPGQVKTRLAAESTSLFAARVADAFLRDTLQKIADFPAERYLAYSPGNSEAWFANLANDRFVLEFQGPGDLGERMTRFLQRRFDSGARRVVIIGADSPTLPADFVQRAFAELDHADVVLGPASDGGYYLVGCGVAAPIFNDIAWGRSCVLSQTVERLGQTGLRLALLPPWYDVDTKEGWEMLRGHCAALRQAGIDPRIPCTETLLHHPLGG